MPNGAKRWCFTINMASDDARNDEMYCWGLSPSDGAQGNWVHYKQEIEYLHFQEEQGAMGTHHLQGFVIFTKKHDLNWVKKFHPRAHWEVARGTNKQADDYCHKEDTRVDGGMHLTIGKLPEKEPPGKAAERLQRAAEELDIIKEGFKRPAEIDSYTLMQTGFLPAFKELTSDILGPYRGPDFEIITLIGPPGTGKSAAIYKWAKDHGLCIVGNNGVWFMNPLAKVMVFEEFCGQIQLQRMLQYLDPYPLALEIKGGMRPAMYTKVIITSNTPPHGWYSPAQQAPPGPMSAFLQKRDDAINALFDRLGYAYAGFVPRRTCGHYYEAPAGADLDACRAFFDKALARHFAEDISDDDVEIEVDDD